MIDRETALAYCDGDEEFYQSILVEFVNESEDYMTRLDSDLNSGDMKDYRIVVHSMKSTGKIIGALDLAALAEEHQRAVEDNDMEFIRQSFPKLMAEYCAVVDEIREGYPIEMKVR